MGKGALTAADNEGIVSRLAKLYGFAMPAVDPMPVSSENALYRVVAGEASWVLKLFKASGSFPRSRVAEHTHYEAQLVQTLIARGVDTAAIRPTVDGRLASTIVGHPAILFEQLSGTIAQRNDCPLENVVTALARMHAVQLEQPLALATGFHFDDAVMVWLPLFHDYRFDSSIDTALTSELNRFAPLVEALNAGERREVLFSRSPSVHCHGDISPRNVMVDSAGRVSLFDFNHAYYGPRLTDVVDAAFQFNLADFADFEVFLNSWFIAAPLSDEERADLPDWVALIGVMRLAKAVRVLVDPNMQSQHARHRERFECIGAILSRWL